MNISVLVGLLPKLVTCVNAARLARGDATVRPIRAAAPIRMEERMMGIFVEVKEVMNECDGQRSEGQKRW